jgi:hypothetical protein
LTKAEYLSFHKDFCDDMIKITAQKNADYTGGNSDPFANFKSIGTLVDVPGVIEIGFLTRMSDKMARIGSFVKNGTLAVKDESVMDTLKDLANYSALFAGYLESNKEKNEAVTVVVNSGINTADVRINQPSVAVGEKSPGTQSVVRKGVRPGGQSEI